MLWKKVKNEAGCGGLEKVGRKAAEEGRRKKEVGLQTRERKKEKKTS